VTPRGRAAQDQRHRFGRQPRLLVSGQSGWTGWTPAQRELVLHDSALPAMHSRLTQLISQGASERERAELQKQIDDVEAFHTGTIADATDIRSALRLALNTGNPGEARTMYLFTDANFNRGDWRAALDTAAASTVRMVALNRPIPPEVSAAELIIPSSVRVNQGFAADLRIASSVETAAKIVVYKDGYASAETPAQLHPGENTVQIPGLYFRDKGFHTIDVAVRAEQDTRAENNRVRAVEIVPGELRVLYVDTDEAQQSYLTSALALEGIQVQARPHRVCRRRSRTCSASTRSFSATSPPTASATARCR
jgi:hypothetical protein